MHMFVYEGRLVGAVTPGLKWKVNTMKAVKNISGELKWGKFVAPKKKGWENLLLKKENYTLVIVLL